MNTTILALLGALAAGLALGVQASINAHLGRALADPIVASCISFGVGFAVLLLLSLPRIAALEWGAVRGLPWWAWTGGAIGTIYMVSMVVGVPRLGVLTMVTAVVLGQVCASLVLDAVGAFGGTVVGVSWQRLLAAACLLAGVVLSRYP
jgi:bacterial/archaeal transporter family-2 protein